MTSEPGGARGDALYRLVGLGAPGYDRADVVRLAGVEHDRTVRWWRAMGFPEVPEGVPAFAELDVEIARRLAAITGAGLLDDDAIMRLARLLGSSFERIAETQIEILEQLLGAREGATGSEDSSRSAPFVDELDDGVLDLLTDSLVYVWRRHLLAAIGRRLAAEEGAPTQAVGFVDLSGFTQLSQRLPADRLARLVDDFEAVGFDTVLAGGGRVVKLIGDAVLFVTPTLAGAVDIALDIAERLSVIPEMPEIHAGIAFGPTVAVGGDVFGPTTNLAARLTTIARRGTIALSEADAAELGPRDDVAVTQLRGVHDLKGIGPTRVVALRPSRPGTPD